ncbi:thrombospondin type 3 repeat-containing protein [Haloarchaeobius iranensis]|uniref:Uncharacterized protein n=1 Tax=Haloarchaeobius iranensis TaxID=996166 RepID=A0A1H0BWL1_9EURY|nr:thrombospondin type 3 repeat-containing protein [Haloarchaeobius iranensis]SDN50079.1 hypothetical protein SAMN05192554_1505 [Haloarchaeobius iranensis]
MTERTVTSDPLANHSDGDGLSDGRERDLGTDPSAMDSDTDRLDDAEELDNGEDPTMFDVSPPEIRVTNSNYVNVDDPTNPRGQYLITAEVSDPSLVTNFTITVDGETYHDRGIPGGPTDRFLLSQTVTVGFGQALLNGLQTNALRLTVGDRYGNAQTTTGYTSSNFYIQAGRELGALETLSAQEATALGLASGIAKSSGSMGETIQQALTNPEEFLAQFTNFQQYITLAQNLERVPGLMVRQYQNDMRTANPYYDIRSDQATHENSNDFARGYYVGVLTFEVALSATGATAGSKIKQLDRVQELASQPRVARALSYYQRAQRVPGRAVGTVTAPAARTGSRIAAGLARRTGVDGDLVRETLGSTATVGRQWWTTQRAQRFGFDRLSGLSETSRSQVSRLLRRSDEDIDDDLRAMSDDDIGAATQFACGVASPSVLYSGRGIVRQSTPDDCGSIDPDAFRGAAALSDDIDSARYEQLLGFNAEVRRTVARVYNQNPDVESREVEKYIQTLNRVDSEGRQSASRLVRELGSEGFRVTNNAYELTDTVEDIGSEDISDLLSAYKLYSESPQARRSVPEIQDDLTTLANEGGGVQGLAKAIRAGKGSVNNVKGLDGEVEAATNLIDAGVEVRELEFNVVADIDGNEVASEIDIDLANEDTGIEIKNRDYESAYENMPDEIAESARQQDIDDLVQKIEVVTRNRDTYIIASRTENIEGTVIEEAIEQANIPEGTTVEVITIEELKEL